MGGWQAPCWTDAILRRVPGSYAGRVGEIGRILGSYNAMSETTRVGVSKGSGDDMLGTKTPSVGGFQSPQAKPMLEMGSRVVGEGFGEGTGIIHSV
jgi:hypothetical protein